MLTRYTREHCAITTEFSQFISTIANTKNFSVWGWEVGNCTPQNGFVPWTMAHIFISRHPSKHVLAYLWLIVWLKLTQSYRSTEFVQRNGETFSGFGLAIHSTKVCPISYTTSQCINIGLHPIAQIYADPNDRSNPYIGSNWSVEDLLTAFSHEVYNTNWSL